MTREAARRTYRPVLIASYETGWNAAHNGLSFIIDALVYQDTDWLLNAYYDSWDRERPPDGRVIVYDRFTILSPDQRHEAHRAVEVGPHPHA